MLWLAGDTPLLLWLAGGGGGGGSSGASGGVCVASRMSARWLAEWAARSSAIFDEGLCLCAQRVDGVGVCLELVRGCNGFLCELKLVDLFLDLGDGVVGLVFVELEVSQCGDKFFHV